MQPTNSAAVSQASRERAEKFGKNILEYRHPATFGNGRRVSLTEIKPRDAA